MPLRACGNASNYELNFLSLTPSSFNGLFLPADFTAEHEWGIRGIQEAFGVPLNPNEDVGIYGLDARKITIVPELHYASDGDRSILFFDERSIIDSKDDLLKSIKRIDLSTPNENGLSAAWCNDAFCIVVTGTDNQVKLRSLYDSILAKNVVIFLGGSDENNPFSKIGLSILLYDNFPADIAAEMIDKDKLYFAKLAERQDIARNALQKAAAALGLVTKSAERK